MRLFSLNMNNTHLNISLYLYTCIFITLKEFIELRKINSESACYYKGEVVPISDFHTMESCRGYVGKSARIPNLSTRWSMSGELHALVSFPSGNEPRVLSYESPL
jgi:hypothetical protein